MNETLGCAFCRKPEPKPTSLMIEEGVIPVHAKCWKKLEEFFDEMNTKLSEALKE